MAVLEKPAQDVHAPITPDEARKALRVGKWTDPSALQLVVQAVAGTRIADPNAVPVQDEPG